MESYNTSSIPHHPVGFSRLGIASQCPAFRREAEGIESIASRASEHGDLLHRASAAEDVMLIPRQDGLDQAMYYRHREFVEERTFEYLSTGREMIDHFHEVTLTLARQNGDDLTYGTLDELIVLAKPGQQPDVGLVFELKSGHSGKIREPDASLQVEAQAAAAFQAYPTLGAVHTFCHNPFQDTVHDRLWARRELPVMLADIEGIVDKTLAEQPSYGPGAACEYCPAVVKCEKAASYALAPVEEVLPGVVERGDDYEITDPQSLAEHYMRWEAQLKILKRVTDRANRILAPAIERGDVPGYRATRRRPLRIRDHEKARDILEREFPGVSAGLDRVVRNTWRLGTVEQLIEEIGGKPARKRARGLLCEEGCAEHVVNAKATIYKETRSEKNEPRKLSAGDTAGPGN